MPHSSRKPSDYDLHIAARLMIARQKAGITQSWAADLIGVSFQQIQKYEHGTNRISAGTLLSLAHAYGYPIGYFYEGIK
jgi:transcriptional regulator with XRE-family HTH domain